MNNQTLTTGLRYYQSANADAESIKADFIIRKEEYEIIIGDIRRNPMNGSVQHYLLLGRRGSGKSTLLKRIQVEIDTDAVLKQSHIAINLAEEQANIYRLYDLLEEIIQELEEKGVDVVMPQEDDDCNAYSRSLFQTIHDAIEFSGKKIVLLLDNIDRIFENLHEDQSLVREMLLNFDDIKIIGGSTRMTEHFWSHDQPFYQFFRVMTLKPLSKEEIESLLLQWSEKRQLPQLKEFVEKRSGQLATIRILTDGLPRTLQFFIDILIKDTEETGYEYLRAIMDKVSPLYQERLNSLPPAQRKIVLQMAFIWESAGAKEIASATHMASKLISAQLKQLIENGIAEKIETNTKNNLYRLSERFFNLWLIFTQGSPKEKRKAKCLTIFLENFYDADGLNVLVSNHLKLLTEGKVAPNKAAIITKALAQSKYISSIVRDELIDSTLRLGEIIDNLKEQLPQTAKNITIEVQKYISKKQISKAVKLAETIEQEDGFREYLIGYIYEQVGEENNAVKYYLLASEKGHMYPLRHLGMIFKERKEYSLAGKYYLKAIEQGDINMMNNLGIVYQFDEKYDLAEKYYLLAMKNGNLEAVNNLGSLYSLQGKSKLSEEYYLKAVNEKSVVASDNLALNYYFNGINKSKALELINYSKENNPEDEGTITLWIVINAWNGCINNLQTSLDYIIKNKKYKYLAVTIEHLLYHYQSNLINNIFENVECGQVLLENFLPYYYAVKLLIDKNSNYNLKIPPEIKATVDEILKNIKLGQNYYYYYNSNAKLSLKEYMTVEK